jgi:hypothetical protein
MDLKLDFSTESGGMLSASLIGEHSGLHDLRNVCPCSKVITLYFVYLFSDTIQLS